MKIIFIILIALIISSCSEIDHTTIENEETQPEIVCNEPYIKNGTGCCLDVNRTGICDKYEMEVEVEKEEIKKDYFSNTDRLHFGEMPVTFGFKTECRQRIEDSMRLAFQSIENETEGIVYFEEVSNNPAISIFCAESERDRDSYTRALGSATCILDNDNPNLIIGGEIYIYGQGWVCGTGYPAVEVHEILHVFGFLHNPSPRSIMYRFSSDYSQGCTIDSIDDVYIDCLRNIYSNGTIPGNCSKINTAITSSDPPLCYREDEFYNTCPEGWYEVDDSDYCCPNSDMKVNDDGCYFEEDIAVCSDGWYPVEGTDYCCSEPNMAIDEDGYCYFENSVHNT